jgi:hypothetical protein
MLKDALGLDVRIVDAQAGGSRTSVPPPPSRKTPVPART